MITQVYLTNDDGFDAPGLLASWEAVEIVWPNLARVVAPHQCFSAKSHATTTHPDSLLEVRDLEHPTMKGVIVEGYPADCVRVGCRGLEEAREGRPLWVAGINPGGNLGIDIYYSGTVAAAREAAALGCPAVSLSVYKQKRVDIDWESVTQWAVEVLRVLKPRLEESPSTLWNVNMAGLDKGSAMPEIQFVPASTDPLDVAFTQNENNGTRRFTYSGCYQDRPRKRGTDVDVVLSGGIAVTPMRLDVTDESLLDTLRLSHPNGRNKPEE
ncbi:MAG: 5'/3'-nucleotidase SurE [Candidatus Omnitrophica bacterium]|nr:5'/3'-nucleotidase SurE [Candidatus Omnitrophota bacterium]